MSIVCEIDTNSPLAGVEFHRKRVGEPWKELSYRITREGSRVAGTGWIKKSTLTITANRQDNQAEFGCNIITSILPVPAAWNVTTLVTIYCK